MPNYLSPAVYSSEIDKTQSTPNLATSSAAIVAAFPKGSVIPKIITTQQQFFREYCVNERMALGNNGQYSALAYLAQGNQLYVQRVLAGNALYAGVKVKLSSSDESNEAFSVGAYEAVFIPNSLEDNLFFILAKDPGAWGTQVSVLIDNVDAAAYTFDIVVYVTDRYSVTSQEEVFTVSRKHQTDGYGAQQYLETAINGISSYIVVADNTAEVDTVVPKENVTAVALVGGADGDTPSDSEVANAWAAFEDPDNLEIRLLINAGYTGATVQLAMKVLAEARRDCIALLDPPYASLTTVETLLTWRNVTSNFNSSFCVTAAPWGKITDIHNNELVAVPPSGYLAARFAYTDSVLEVWDAAAGFQNSAGILPWLGLAGYNGNNQSNYSKGERDSLYPAQINTIQNWRGQGIVVWGNKTMQSSSSALSSVNVRRSLIVLEKTIAIALRAFLFARNSITTRLRVKATLDEYLSKLAARGAFQQETDQGYSVICDLTNNTTVTIDAGELHVDVYIKPIHVVEYIIFKTIVSKTGTDITAVGASSGQIY